MHENLDKAKTDGFSTVPIEQAVDSDLLIIALPDEVQGEVYSELIEPHLNSGTTLGFIHGFRFGMVKYLLKKV